MRLRTPLAVVAVVGVLLVGCGDDDVDTSTGDSTSSTSTTTAEPPSGSVDGPPPPDDSVRPAVTVEIPASLADAMTEMAVEDHAWFATLHRVETGAGVGHLGTGISPEPAEVIDPQASITGNQALAAAHGVAGDLLDSPGDAEVLVSEQSTVEPGRPGWHVRLRFHGPDVAADVDVIGFEDGGSFHYAAAVTQGLDEHTTAALQGAVAAATAV